MPTKEAIVDNIIPKTVAAPIPTKIATTRDPRPKAKEVPAVQENGNQQDTTRNNTVADSTTTEESVKLSPQLSALARKEQAFRQREQVLKQREKDLEAKLASADEYTQLKAKLGAKDFSDAEKLGLNYEEYVQYKLDQANGEDPNAQAVKALELKIQALEKGQEESAEQEFEETVAAYKKEITSVVSTNEEFSSIKELKAEGHVLQLILDSWEEDKIEMSVDEACKEIENALVEQGKKFSTLPKLKMPAEKELKLPPPKPGVKTLTNQMQASSVESKPVKPLHTLSENERYAEARRRVLARRQQQGS